jgi:NAD-dependent dihydropyrimidine dehydrogenase PreA subunit
MKRQIVKIADEKCNGCGLCIPNCHEGALQIIDGKARLVSDLMCDGLGACIGYCPEGAISIEEREAAPYNETEVIKEMLPKGKNLVVAHLKHLKNHNEVFFFKQAINFLEENPHLLTFSLTEVMQEVHNVPVSSGCAGSCPGSTSLVIERDETEATQKDFVEPVSELRQWPIQMHLLNPNATYLHKADLVLAADCVAFALGNFHQKWLKGKSLAIACPKLDSNKEVYIEKLKTMIDEAEINSITVMIMEVPCCGGLLQLVKSALKQSKRKLPIKSVVISIKGILLSEDWITI